MNLFGLEPSDPPVVVLSTGSNFRLQQSSNCQSNPFIVVSPWKPEGTYNETTHLRHVWVNLSKVC